MVCAWTTTYRHTLDSVPRLYALRRAEDEPAAVIAWGLAFDNGRALTLWCDPYPGAATMYTSLQIVEDYHAPNVGADLVWPTAPTRAWRGGARQADQQ